MCVTPTQDALASAAFSASAASPAARLSGLMTWNWLLTRPSAVVRTSAETTSMPSVNSAPTIVLSAPGASTAVTRITHCGRDVVELGSKVITSTFTSDIYTQSTASAAGVRERTERAPRVHTTSSVRTLLLAATDLSVE